MISNSKFLFFNCFRNYLTMLLFLLFAFTSQAKITKSPEQPYNNVQESREVISAKKINPTLMIIYGIICEKLK